MDMTTERPTAVHALYDGDAAYYVANGVRSIGTVPCKVLWFDARDQYQPEGLVWVEAAAAQGTFEKGERFPVLPSMLHHPDAIHGHHFPGGPRILGRTVYMGAR